jgi:hypothetical protein
MRTYPIIDEEKGELYAFEVENAYILPKRVARILREVNGVTDVRRVWDRATDNRVQFKFEGRDYVVYEPYGDSSLYWIGPKDDRSTDISAIEKAFKQYQPHWYQRFVGDILTLRVITRFITWNK